MQKFQNSLSASSVFFTVAAALSISACKPTVNTNSAVSGGGGGPSPVSTTQSQSQSKPQQRAVASGSENDDAVTSVSVDAPAGTSFSGFIVDLGAQFTRANICSGATIFGRAGTAVCGAIGSMVHVDLQLPRAERPIPDASLDNDGTFPGRSGSVRSVSFSNTFKFKNGSGDCGLSGTIEQRITDCSYRWDGQALGNMGQSIWTLVARKKATATTREFRVWLDERTGLIWSSALLDPANEGGTNWCQASGNIQNVSGVDCSPGSTSGLQPIQPISMCAEAPGLDSNGFDGPKGGLRAEVEWHLPSRNERLQAEINGLYFVLSPTEASAQSGGEWTATTAYQAASGGFSDTPGAYITVTSPFDGLLIAVQHRSDTMPGVRCVGRPK